MSEKRAYCQAAHTGKYERPAGLLGKYDNVRRFWEDRITADFLAPILDDLAARKMNRNERVRILDLGCGSGDGFDLLGGVSRPTSIIGDVHTSALSPEVIEEYVGVDLNDDLIRQAEACYGTNPKVRFEQGDLSKGLPRHVQSLNA
ncbi:MAG: class I SAM-dependent methyltransferase, partial [Desulfomonilaceae bacterium]|nr:class I SAM-dependent methyltransferase [Desulfomonilaceae bacterium]